MEIRQKSYGSNSVQIGCGNVIKGSNIISGTAIINGTVIINGVELPPPPTDCRSTTVINNKVYIDGYEFKNGRWKKTLRAWWHLWF
jgi:hypothetical protein